MQYSAMVSLKAAMFFLTIFSFLILSPKESPAGLLGPSNYDDCILESMKGVTSNLAARAIVLACRKKFPQAQNEQQKTRELSIVEKLLLTGRAGHSFGNYFSGNIYNGNTNVTVKQVTISVTTTFKGEEVTQQYVDDVDISPQTTADFGFNILVGDKNAEYSWGIVGARGN